MIFYFGGFLLCGFTRTVFGPGFGLFGFGLGVGEGFDLLCGLTGTTFAIISNFKVLYVKHKTL